MKKIILLTLVLGVLASIGFAQVSGYVFSYSAGIYSEINGGTVLGTAAINGGVNTSLDSGFYNATPIPFPFNFNGLPYTETTVSSDGYILMGGPNAVGYTPISHAAVNDGVIAALGHDLIGITTEGSLGEIRYQTLGESPNRTFVVQWKNFRSYSASNENYNFQIRLHENSAIDFVYGPMLVNPPYNPTCQIGLRGALNTDFNNRTTTTNWAASTQGTTNTASMALTSTCYPANGTTFTYTVTVLSAPNPVVMTYPADNGWAFTDGVLKWTNNGGYPSSFDVYFGESSPPAFVANITTISYAPVLAANTTYYWKIEPRNAFGVTAGTVRTFKTPNATQLAESFENTAFPPGGWVNPGSWTRSTTSAYHLTASANKSASTTPAILSTPKLTITASSNLCFYYRTGSTNGNGRLQLVSSPDRSTWTPVGTPISMPTTNYWLYASYNLSSLVGQFYLGFQVYTTSSTNAIYIDHVFGPEITAEAPGPVTLTAPADLVTDVNPLTTFSWTQPTSGGVPLGYKLYCDTSADPTTLLTTTTDFTYTLTSPLLYGTSYKWKVVAYNNSGFSTPNTIGRFTTWADQTIHVFPWSESFDGTTFAPVGWNNFKTAGTSLPGIWNRSTTGGSPTCTPHSGAAMARYNSSSIPTGGKAELISPPIATVNGNGYKVNFWMYRDSGYATKINELVNVYVSNTLSSLDGTLIGTIHRHYGFTPVEETANQWYQYTLIFTGTIANRYIIFEGVSEYGNNIFIDDVSVDNIAAPAAPALTYPANSQTGLPQEGFNFTWSPDLINGDPPAYYVLFIATSEETIYDEAAFDNITDTSFNPANSSVDPIMFAYGTKYYWTVQAVNSSGDAVAEPIRNFTIEIGPPDVTITINAGNVVLDWSPGVTGATSYQVQSSTFPGGPWFNEVTPAGLTWTGAVTVRKFYKVIAIQ